jgi:hypothetical protein|tara:strand:+ start:258 stop:455 length:198 start_codon:yes stop_codon:yes gene_type:complete
MGSQPHFGNSRDLGNGWSLAGNGTGSLLIFNAATNANVTLPRESVVTMLEAIESNGILDPNRKVG